MMNMLNSEKKNRKISYNLPTSSSSKKGLAMPEEVGMTLVLLVVAMVMIVILIFTYIQVRLPVLSSGNPVGYSIDFVSIANRPFMLAEVLSRIHVGDRTLLEQATESAVTGSLEGAAATELPGQVTSLMKSYDMRNYRITIIRDGNTILDVDNTELKCGENKEGWCVFGDCDVGRVEIAQGTNACASAWAKCCKEDVNAYVAAGAKCKNGEQCNVIKCANEKGVCSEGVRPLDPGIYPLRLYATKPHCSQNRIDLGLAAECAGTNNGKTRVCCAPKTEANEVEAQVLTKATVPLLYKIQLYGTLEVTGR